MKHKTTKLERAYQRHCENYKTSDYYKLKYTFYVAKTQDLTSEEVIEGFAIRKNITPIKNARSIKFIKSEYLDIDPEKTKENIKRKDIKTFRISKTNFMNVDKSSLPFDVEDLTNNHYIYDKDNVKICYNFLKTFNCLPEDGRCKIISCN